MLGEWVELPINIQELSGVFDRIGINEEYEEWFIADYDKTDIPSFKIDEYDDVNELNYLAILLNEKEEYELSLLDGAAELTGSSNAGQIINLIENLDCFQIVYDVYNDYDLGYYYIEESGIYDLRNFGNLTNYIDYEAFGRDVRLEECGVYTDSGYVYECDNIAEIYAGENDIPEEYVLNKTNYSQQMKL